MNAIYTNPTLAQSFYSYSSKRSGELNAIKLKVVRRWKEYQDIINKMNNSSHPLLKPHSIKLRNELRALFLATLPTLDETGVTTSPFEELLKNDQQITLLFKGYKGVVSILPLAYKLDHESLRAQKNIYELAGNMRVLLINDFNKILS